MPQQHELEHLTDPTGPGLHHRFQGRYRAVVVETNDPLCMHRIRFKCPEMHNFDLPAKMCPWACTSPTLGGKKSSAWHSYCIGDQVWIDFEKDHPYGPVVVGFADPLRRKLYSNAAIYCPTPLPVDEHGKAAEKPNDFDEDYLPKDGRPMSSGTQDRYGNLDLSNTVGFFPTEHKQAAPSAGYDALQHATFNQSTEPPKVNDPDAKYMARITKYGHMVFMGDQGYHWQKNDNDNSDNQAGEFYGDYTKDEKFEAARWKYIQRLINEDEPNNHDQRRIEIMSRYGSKIEIRDVGWAQKGPIKSKSRDGEYGEPTTLSKEANRDQRWLKLRTKAGHLFQMCDMGAHPDKDEFIKRKLIDEVGDKADGEDDWQDKDARQIRIVTRYGYKIVLDDRGSHSTKANLKERPLGNGVLVKGRRTPGSHGEPPVDDHGKPVIDPRGFHLEFNENDDTNQATLMSPLGHVFQINDKQQYMMLASRRAKYPTSWKGLKENEFVLGPLAAHIEVPGDDDGSGQPPPPKKIMFEDLAHCLKLDSHNESIRLKTRTGKGDKPHGDPVNKPPDEWDPDSEDYKPPINQGFEARDGKKGDGPWVEIVDGGGRNLWFAHGKKLIVCHAREIPEPIKIMWWINEESKEFVLRHDEEEGKIQIFADNVEIISRKSLTVHAAETVFIKGEDRVVLSGGSTDVQIDSEGLKCTGPIIHPDPDADPPVDAPSVDTPDLPEEVGPPQLSPTDRGQRYNDGLDKPAPIEEIQHKVNTSGND